MSRLYWISCYLFARPASAARRTPPAPTAPAAAAPPDAANDAPANERGAPLPACVLTDAQRAELHARAMALPPEAVRPLPSRVDARATRLLQLTAAAHGDRARLEGFELDGAPITAAELDGLLPLATWVNEVVTRRDLPSLTPADPDAPPDDAAMAAALSAAIGVVCNALALRHAQNRRLRAVIARVRTDRGAAGLARGATKLLALCDDAATGQWLAALPKGEAAAVATLRAMQPEWSRRVTAREVAPTEAEAPTPRAMAQRAWSLALVEMERVLRAGRYLAKGDAAKESAWRAYQAPKAKKAAAKAPAEGAAQPVK